MFRATNSNLTGPECRAKDGIVALLLCQLLPAQGNQLSQQFKVMMYQALVK